MHTAQALMLQVDSMKMTLLYFLVKRNKFFTFKISNWVNLRKLCNPSNIGECLMSRKSGVENPMIIQKIVTHSNNKRLLMFSLSMLRIILLTIVWVMLKLRLFLKVELQEMLMKMKSMTYLMLIFIWIMICKIHNNCLKCYVLVLKFYACLSSNCFVLILNLIWILMQSFVVLSQQ